MWTLKDDEVSAYMTVYRPAILTGKFLIRVVVERPFADRGLKLLAIIPRRPPHILSDSSTTGISKLFVMSQLQHSPLPCSSFSPFRLYPDR
jgi:hypothetical protein